MDKRWSLKRSLLHTVIGALVLSALVGVYVLLFGTFGKTEERILLTTLSISYFSVTSLACAAAFEKKRHPLLSVPGLVLGIAGFLLFIPGIWADWWRFSAFAKTSIIVGVFSFSFAQACLLSLATLERRLAWVFCAAVVFIMALAGMISAMVIWEPKGEWIVRIAGAVGIFDGCLSLCVPILHRLGGRQAAPTAETFKQIELVCPRCGQRGIHPLGRIECPQCSLVLTVQIETEAQRSVEEETAPNATRRASVESTGHSEADQIGFSSHRSWRE